MSRAKRRRANRHYRVDRRKIGRRIRSTFKNGESVYAFSRRTHTNTSNLYRFLDRQVGIGLEQLVRISRATGRSMDWLVGLRK